MTRPQPLDMAGPEPEPMTGLARIRERIAEDERRTYSEAIHDQRHIIGHDCYECCALDRAELYAIAVRSFRDRETQREARSGAVVAWIVAAALVVAVVWWVLR